MKLILSRIVFAAGISGVVFFLVSCAGYKLGQTGFADSQSISILPFPNHTSEPRLVPVLASAMRRQIQSEGIMLDTRNEADLILSGSILAFERVGVSFQPDDIITIRDFQLRLTAQIKLIKRRTGEIIFDQPISGTSLIRAFDDLASAERQALPLLAQDLARKAGDLLVDGNW